MIVSSCCRPYGVHWWWVPVAGPFVGAPLGAWTYYWLIEFQHPPIELKKTTEVVGNPMVVLANEDKASNGPEIEDNVVSMVVLANGDKTSYEPQIEDKTA